MIRSRRGFSLIELLIVVAIIAALVGVAVPFFQDNLSEAQRTKAKQDIEIIKKAISLYDARESKPLVGTDLKPLLGRYMQELAKDPWGNDYLFDGNLGMVASYGADALPLGSGAETDIVVYTRPPLMITRVQYQGSWGRPRAQSTTVAPPPIHISASTGNKFIVSFSKPFGLNSDPRPQVVLLTNTQDNAIVGGWPDGGAYALNNTADTNWDATAWGNFSISPSGTSSASMDRLEDPASGVTVFGCLLDQVDGDEQTVTPTMAMDLVADDASGVSLGGAIIETYYDSAPSAQAPAGPMDDSVYGADAYAEYSRDPQAVELVNGFRRGIRLEKY